MPVISGPNRTYFSPPNSNGNDGALPTVYDSNWQAFNNLTPQQVLAFQSFPQDLVKYAANQRWLAESSGVTIGGISVTTMDRDQAKVAQLKQAFDNGAIPPTTVIPFFDANGNIQSVNAAVATILYNGVVAFVESTFKTAATLVAGINATPATITTRKQIDAAYAAIAPNSPSATTPSPT